MGALHLAPNRRKQFEGHLIPFVMLASGLLLAFAAVVGWIEPATRTQRGAIWGILLVSPVVLYRLAEQLLRPVVRVRESGIAWWTIDRKSGSLPPNQIACMKIVGSGENQKFQVLGENGFELEIPIQPIGDPERFISEAFDRLGIAPKDWPHDLPDSS